MPPITKDAASSTCCEWICSLSHKSAIVRDTFASRSIDRFDRWLPSIARLQATIDGSSSPESHQRSTRDYSDGADSESSYRAGMISSPPPLLNQPTIEPSIRSAIPNFRPAAAATKSLPLGTLICPVEFEPQPARAPFERRASCCPPRPTQNRCRGAAPTVSYHPRPTKAPAKSRANRLTCRSRPCAWVALAHRLWSPPAARPTPAGEEPAASVQAATANGVLREPWLTAARSVKSS